MATGDLCSTQEFVAARTSYGDGADANEIGRCIAVASRWLAQECGRQLHADTGVSTRTFEPPYSSDLILVDDISTLTGLVVVDNGTTLAIDSDVVALPPGGRLASGEAGPWYMLRRTYGIPWTWDGGRLTVSVTATWGWPGGASPVAKQACFEVIADLLRMRGTNFGVIGIDAGLAVRLRTNTHVAELLGTYRRGDRAPGWAVA